MTWLSTWDQHGSPAFAEHPTEAAAKAHAETKRQGGVRATWFWSSENEWYDPTESTEEAS